MNDFSEIITFSAQDITSNILRERLENKKIDFIFRETTAFMEPGCEFRIKHSDRDKVNEILNDISNIKDNQSQDLDSIFGNLRKFDNWFTWASIVGLVVLLVYMSKLILNGSLPIIAWTAILFMAAIIFGFIYIALKRK